MWITAALQAYRNVGWTIFWILSLQIPVEQGISYLRPHRAGLRAAPGSPQYLQRFQTSGLEQKLSPNFRYLRSLILQICCERHLVVARSRKKAPDISGALFRGTTFVLAGAS